MPPLPRPCLDCGRLTQASRCETCNARKETYWANQRDPNTRIHYRGDYRKRAKAVREAPGPCYLCGEGEKPNDPFQADHVEAGNPYSPLAKCHRSCNVRKGNKPIGPGTVNSGWGQN